MSNCCCSCYCFHSTDREELERLYLAIEESKNLFELAKKQLGKENVSIGDYRSEIIIVNPIEKKSNGEYFFRVDTDDAWSPKEDKYKEILQKKFPAVDVCVLGVEEGCGVFVNTDDSGDFFPEEYVLNAGMYIDGEYVDSWEFFTSEDDLLKYIHEVFGIDAESAEDAEKLAWKEIEKKDNDGYFTVGKFN